MPRIFVRKYSPDWGSHFPVLIKILEVSDGTVLELGTGVFSTPLLHTLCQVRNRQLVSYESDPYYVERHSDFITPLHQINLVTNWDDVKIEDTLWDVAFIDHKPERRRKIEVERLANTAKYIILHDSETRNDKLYKYSETYSLFKYRFDYTACYPHTTVLSNLIDLSKLAI